MERGRGSSDSQHAGAVAPAARRRPAFLPASLLTYVNHQSSASHVSGLIAEVNIYQPDSQSRENFSIDCNCKQIAKRLLTQSRSGQRVQAAKMSWWAERPSAPACLDCSADHPGLYPRAWRALYATSQAASAPDISGPTLRLSAQLLTRTSWPGENNLGHGKMCGRGLTTVEPGAGATYPTVAASSCAEWVRRLGAFSRGGRCEKLPLCSAPSWWQQHSPGAGQAR